MAAKTRKNASGMIGFALLGMVLSCALFAPWISRADPASQNLGLRLRPPSSSHWFGTDDLGRDVESRVVYGSRVSLAVGCAATFFAFFFGCGLGLFAGFYGGWVDHGLMGFLEVLMAFPSILLAIAIVAFLGPNLRDATLAIGIVSIPIYARVARSQVLSLKGSEFVEAARAIGNSDMRILIRHIFPNSLPPLVIQVTLGIGGAILDLAGLSFLGLGAQPPLAEWGSMLSDTVRFLEKAPWAVIFPGMMLTASVLAFNLIGDRLRDWLDPRSQRT